MKPPARGLMRRKRCPKCEVMLPILDFLRDRRLRRVCNHCRRARLEESNALTAKGSCMPGAQDFVVGQQSSANYARPLIGFQIGDHLAAFQAAMKQKRKPHMLVAKKDAHYHKLHHLRTKRRRQRIKAGIVVVTVEVTPAMCEKLGVPSGDKTKIVGAIRKLIDAQPPPT
jgi:hypothetical protein